MGMPLVNLTLDAVGGKKMSHVLQAKICRQANGDGIFRILS